MQRPVIAAFVLALSACGSASTTFEPADLAAMWGGQHAVLRIDSTATLEYDCARGSMDALPQPGSDGRFAVGGSHVFLHGGPIRDGEPEDRHPAEYLGQVSGATMTLRVRVLDRATELGPFTLRRGEGGTLFRCL
jgi:hypothetical protein